MPATADWVHIGPISIYDWQRLDGETSGGRVKRGEWADYEAELVGDRVPLVDMPRPCPWPLFVLTDRPTADVIRAWRQVIRHKPTGGYVEARWHPDTGLTMTMTRVGNGGYLFIRGKPGRRGRRWGEARAQECVQLLAALDEAAHELSPPLKQLDVMEYTRYERVETFRDALRRCGTTWQEWQSAHKR